MKWTVPLQVDATISMTVEADSAEQAMQIAEDTSHVPGLCHHYSLKISLGDVIKALDAEKDD